jgi:hypothetical protein
MAVTAVTYTASDTGVPNNLWQLIQDYTSNYETTFVANIPQFVQITEERIYNSVQIPAIRKNQTGAMTAGNQYLQLPSDWLATFSLAISDTTQTPPLYVYLIDKDVNFIREAYPSPTTLNTPKYFAQFDYQTLIVGPTPDVSYPVELHYYYVPTSIVTAGTSWLGNNFPEVLLYGALREAYIFMKGEADVLEMYEKKYMEGMDRLKQLGDGKNRRDAFRDGQVRVPVK